MSCTDVHIYDIYAYDIALFQISSTANIVIFYLHVLNSDISYYDLQCKIILPLTSNI